MADENLSIKLDIQNAAGAAAGVSKVRTEIDKLGDESRETGREMGRVTRSSNAARRGMMGLGGQARVTGGGLRLVATAAAAGAAAFGAVGLAGAIGMSVKNFQESQGIIAQAGSAIRATGGAAGISVMHIENMSDAMSRKNAVDDESIALAQTQLLAFRNIRNGLAPNAKIFDRTTQAAIDMARRTGTDVPAAMAALGKAVNEPAKRASLLARSGRLATSDVEKLQAMSKRGVPMWKQQAYLLSQVEKRYKGAGAAFAATDEGKIEKTKIAIGNLSEQVGGALSPHLADAAEKAGVFVNGMVDGEGAGGRFAEQMRSLGSQIAKATGFVVKHRDGILALVAGLTAGMVAYKAFMIINTVVKSVGLAITVFKALRAGTYAATIAQLGLNGALIANPIGIIVAGVIGLGVAFVVAYKKVDWFRNGIKKTLGWVKAHWKGIVVALTGPIGLAVVGITSHWGSIKSGFSSMIDWIVDKWYSFAKIINKGIDLANKAPGVSIDRIPVPGGGGGGPSPLVSGLAANVARASVAGRPVQGPNIRTQSRKAGRADLAGGLGQRFMSAAPQASYVGPEVISVQVAEREIGRATVNYGRRVGARA